MNTFDRHLLREWIQILFLVLATLCGLLFVQICYDDFRQLLEVGAPASDFWRYVLVTMPSFLGVVLPLALLISLLYTLTKFHRSNELTAMRVAGVGFLRLTAPVWAVGLVACGIVWWLNSTIVPWSVEQSRLLEESMQHRRQEKVLPPDRVGAVYSVAFDNPDARRTWFFNRYRKAAPARGYGVSVSEMDPLRRETTRIVAAQAWHDEGRGAGSSGTAGSCGLSRRTESSWRRPRSSRGTSQASARTPGSCCSPTSGRVTFRSSNSGG